MSEDEASPVKDNSEQIRWTNNNNEKCSGDPDTCPHHSFDSGSASKKENSSESMEECMGRSLETLSNAFTASAKRWEAIVYPALFAFILLAAYGFFLIFSLTKDVSKVAHHMGEITQHMGKVSTTMDIVSKNMIMMTHTVDAQSASMQEMAINMRGMNMSMSQMRYDISVMNNSVSRPMSFMNTFMPW